MEEPRLIMSLGFHASNDAEYATEFARALSMSPEMTVAMRQRARASAKRFGEEAFSKLWIKQMEKLVSLQKKSLRL